MTVLVTGTPQSGKSEFAENMAVHTGGNRYYIATMKIIDDAGKERVKRHRKQREGKGFITIEQEYRIKDVTDRIEDPGEATVLLECVSNLVGNEMHDDPDRIMLINSGASGCERFAEEVADEIRQLSDSVGNLIIVTATYEEDGEGYDDDTRLFVKLLKSVNEKLSAFADKTYDMGKGAGKS